MKTKRLSWIVAMVVMAVGSLAARAEDQAIGPEKKVIMVGPGMPTSVTLWNELRIWCFAAGCVARSGEAPRAPKGLVGNRSRR